MRGYYPELDGPDYSPQPLPKGEVTRRLTVLAAKTLPMLSRVVIWSSLPNPAMDCLRDERISGTNNRSSADCHPKSEMGTVSDRVAGFTKCIAECNLDRRHVRVYRGGPGARSDFH